MNNADVMKELQNELGMVPEFFMSLKEIPGVMEPLWKKYREIELGEMTIPVKYRKLIGVAAGAAMKSEHCVNYHWLSGRAMGLTEQELREAALVAAHVSGWSSYLYGRKVEYASFVKQINEIMAHMKNNKGKEPPVSGKARDNLKAILGQIPFMFQEVMKLDGLVEHDFNLFKMLQMQEGSIPMKYRELTGLAAAVALHCPFCIHFHTEKAKLMGATEIEINETSYLVKENALWGTYLGGIEFPKEKIGPDVSRLTERLKSKVSV